MTKMNEKLRDVYMYYKELVRMMEREREIKDMQIKQKGNYM